MYTSPPEPWHSRARTTVPGIRCFARVNRAGQPATVPFFDRGAALALVETGVDVSLVGTRRGWRRGSRQRTAQQLPTGRANRVANTVARPMQPPRRAAVNHT